MAASAVVLEKWRRLAEAARKAGLTAPAEKAEEQVRVRERAAATPTGSTMCFA